MILPDVIVSWPRHLDYPLWRQFIHENRDRFSKVIVVFTNMKTAKDYRPWLREQLAKDSVSLLDSDEVENGLDWRDISTKKGLALSENEWVWFAEQDFFPKEDFWKVVETLSNATSVVGFFQGDRLHPCCIFIKRSLLDTISKYFGVVKDKLDHFGQLQKDLDDKGIPIGIIAPAYGYHYNGLSQNMYMLQIGEQPNYFPDEFKDYCKRCLQAPVVIHPEIKELMESYV